MNETLTSLEMADGLTYPSASNPSEPFQDPPTLFGSRSVTLLERSGDQLNERLQANSRVQRGDRFVGDRGDNRLLGDAQNNTLLGKKGHDRLIGGDGNDQLLGHQGKDLLMGGSGRDRLVGGAGDDVLNGGKDKNRYFGGQGKDIIRVKLSHGSRDRATTSIVYDFQDGKDTLEIDGVRFDDLIITSGSDTHNRHAMVQHQPTGKYLLLLKNVAPELITIQDIDGNQIHDPAVSPVNPSPSPSPSPHTSPSSPSPSSLSPSPDITILPLPDQDQYNVMQGTNDDDDPLKGTSGQDWIEGLDGDDRIESGAGSDFLVGGTGKDIYTTGGGQDIILIGLGHGASDLKNANVVTDFEDGNDRIWFEGFRSSSINIVAGTGSYVGDTVVRSYATGGSLLIIKDHLPSQITLDDFIFDPDTEALPPLRDWHSDTVQVSPFVTNFNNVDASDEAQVDALSGASVKIGTQRLYIGYRQVSGNNQNPVILSFDDENPSNNWQRTDYEVTGSDSKGYGLFWNGTDLYAVFSVDGTQGDATEDFRRASSDVTTGWLRSYGAGGGAKVAVVTRIDPTNGALLDAAYLSAVLTNGKSNTLNVVDLSMNDQGNLLVRSNARYYPRDVQGKIIDVSGDAPFDYTVELTPNLKQVLSTSVVEG